MVNVPAYKLNPKVRFVFNAEDIHIVVTYHTLYSKLYRCIYSRKYFRTRWIAYNKTEPIEKLYEMFLK